MKRLFYMKGRTPWLLLLLLTDLFFVFVSWLIAPRAFLSVFIMILLFSAAVVIAGTLLEYRMKKKQIEAVQNFLEDPDETGEQALLSVMDAAWHPVIHQAAIRRKELACTAKDRQLELLGYQEYIEAWTHEIKTPLSLATLVLNNHRDEMSAYVYGRMSHVEHTISAHVDRILYYARLHAEHMDYKFETLDVCECVRECLDDFLCIAGEKHVDVQLELTPVNVVSDRKVIAFMLSQLLSNAFKYTAADNGIVRIITWQDTAADGKIYLAVRDNGSGVSAADLPFIFDKGFTGSFPNRQNATGMGLYLVWNYAQMLAIDVSVEDVSTLLFTGPLSREVFCDSKTRV